MKRATVITAANNKGGCGKTTTALAIAAEMAGRGLRVLIVDTDSQCNATQSMPQADDAADTYSLLHGGTGKPVNMAQNLQGIRSSKDMAVIDMNLPALKTGNAITEMLQPYMAQYDVIIIDTPPATGLLTLNALKAADYVLIPLQTSLYGLQGVGELIDRLHKIGKDSGSIGIVQTMFERRKTVHRQAKDMIQQHYGSALLSTTIRNCIAVVEAPLYGSLLRDYAPKATATADYAALTDEIITRLKI